MRGSSDTAIRQLYEDESRQPPIKLGDQKKRGKAQFGWIGSQKTHIVGSRSSWWLPLGEHIPKGLKEERRSIEGTTGLLPVLGWPRERGSWWEGRGTERPPGRATLSNLLTGGQAETSWQKASL